MKGKLLLGIVLFVVGFTLAVVTAAGVTRLGQSRDASAVVGDQNEPARDQASSLVLPILAGVSIAAGATLVGIGIGNFRRPTIVPANSPKADEAATTRSLGDEGTRGTTMRNRTGA